MVILWSYFFSFSHTRNTNLSNFPDFLLLFFGDHTCSYWSNFLTVYDHWTELDATDYLDYFSISIFLLFHFSLMWQLDQFFFFFKEEKSHCGWLSNQTRGGFGLCRCCYSVHIEHYNILELAIYLVFNRLFWDSSLMQHSNTTFQSCLFRKVSIF